MTTPRRATRSTITSPGEMSRLAAELEEAEREDADATGREASPPQPSTLTFEVGSPTFGSPNSGYSAEALADAANAAASAIPTPGSRQSTTTSTTVRTVRRPSPPGTTTAQKQKKSKGATTLKCGNRVWTNRKSLFSTGILSEIQKESLKQLPQSYRLCGTLTSGAAKSGHLVECDWFPAGHKQVVGISRGRIHTLAAGEEEPEQLDTLAAMEEKEANQKARNAKEPTPLEQSILSFKSMPKEEQATSKLYEMPLPKDKTMEWEILADNEHLGKDDDPLIYPENLELKKDIDFVSENSRS